MEQKTKQQVLEETLSPMYMPEIKMAGHAHKQIIEAMDIWSQQQNQEQLELLKEMTNVLDDLCFGITDDNYRRAHVLISKYDQLTNK